MDARRIYVFGVSAGGCTVFDVCMFDSQYLAAGAVFTDVITPDFDWIVHKATPKIPIAIYTGIATSSSPLPGAENTQSACQERIFGPTDHVSRSGSQLRRGGCSVDQKFFRFYMNHPG